MTSDERIAEFEAQLREYDSENTRLEIENRNLKDSNHHLGEQNYILTGRMAELEAQLAEANGVIDANRWPDTAAKLLREAESRAEQAEARLAVSERERNATMRYVGEIEMQLAEANARTEAASENVRRMIEQIEAWNTQSFNQLKREREAAEARAEAAESVNGQLLGLIRTAREQLNDLLIDEDLDDEKLREASEGLLPNIVDRFSEALQAAATQPDCGHPFRVGDVCPTCVAADAERD